MQEDVKLLDHINKVKALVDQLTYLEVFMREWRYCYDFAWDCATLIRTLDYHLRDHTDGWIDYVVCDGTFDTWDAQEKEEGTSGYNGPMILRKGKWGISSSQKDVKVYYYYVKVGRIVCFCYKEKNKDK